MPRRAHSVAHTSAARSSPSTIRSYVLLGTLHHDATLARYATGRQALNHLRQENVLFALDARVERGGIVVGEHGHRNLRDDRPTVEARVDEVDADARDLHAVRD